MSDVQKAGAARRALWRQQSRASCRRQVLVLCVLVNVLDPLLGLSCDVSIHRAQIHWWGVGGWANGFIIRRWWRLEGKHDTQVVSENYDHYCHRDTLFSWTHRTPRHIPMQQQWGVLALRQEQRDFGTNLVEESVAYVTSQSADF